eukprot:SAG31_NODE_25575_length_458_cov_5.512535_1_plen_80_part_01
MADMTAAEPGAQIDAEPPIYRQAIDCKLTSLDVGGESGVAVRCVVLLSLGTCFAWRVLVGRWADACCGVELRSEGGKRAD